MKTDVWLDYIIDCRFCVHGFTQANGYVHCSKRQMLIDIYSQNPAINCPFFKPKMRRYSK